MKIRLFLIILLFFNIGIAQVTNEGKPKSWKLDLSYPKAVKMKPFNLKTLQVEDEINDELKDKPFRFGFEHQVSLGFEDGKWNQLKNGDKIWLLNVKSDGAKTLNFLFDEFLIPRGAKLYFYNNDRTDLLGAYTSTQNRDDLQFGSWLIDGDNIWIEYFEPADASFEGQLHISKVVHGYRSVNDIPELSKALNDSGPCNQDVDCPVGDDFDSKKDELKKSVAMILVGSSGFCSGSLINNTRNDGSPLFLTANHCLGSSVSSWAFRFNWISPSPSCSTTTNSPNGNFNQTVSGASLLASNSKSDFALLEIDAPLPNDWDLVWAGWDRSGDIPDFTVSIHHPSGDIMKVSRDDDSPEKNSRSFNGIDDMDNWFLNEWELGVTEAGSSGSPLFDQDGRIIGQLAGGAAACDGTINNQAFDYYGRFGVSWDFGDNSSSRLKEWLDPDDNNPLTLDQFPPAQVFNNDVALIVENINEPICGDEAFPTFVIANRGVNVIESATLTYNYGDQAEETIVWSGALAEGESSIIGEVALDLNLGNTLEATLEIEGITDEFQENNSVVRAIDNYENNRFTTNTVNFTLLTDDFASETSWVFLDSSGTIIDENETELLNNTTYEIQFDVDQGSCYELLITDSEADGICCGFGIGSYRLETDSQEIIAEGGEFGSTESIKFRINEVVEEDELRLDIYPNPVSSILFVESNSEEEFDVKLFDIRGRLLYENRVEERLELDLLSFSTGIYFIKIDSESQSITKKIIKN
jgi:hypothetical protein